MMTSLPVQITSDDNDGRFVAESAPVDLVSDFSAGKLEAKDHISNVTSFVGPASRYNNQDIRNSGSAQNSEPQVRPSTWGSCFHNHNV